MKNIIRTFWGILLLLTILWIAADLKVFQAPSVFALRRFMVQYSGVLAMGSMSVAMILALRPRWPERWFGGLDKMYRLHKWLGISGLVLAIVHWLWVEAPKWAVRSGLLERPQRGHRPAIDDPVREFLSSLRGPAEGLGEWAFYAVVLLIVLALVPRLPYRRFYSTHRVLPVAYLVLVFHSVVLTTFSYWTTPLGVVQAILLAGGTYAAVVSLLGFVGAGRRVKGTISALQQYPGVRALETIIDLGPGWPGHKAGQFAFATSDAHEGAHPYTIASAWNPADPRITFVTKELGDYTATLVDRLRVGQEVMVEGPYGNFTFDDDRPRQIWIGGGIGITPFISRMKHLARAPVGRAAPGDRPVPHHGGRRRGRAGTAGGGRARGGRPLPRPDRRAARAAHRRAHPRRGAGLARRQHLVLRPGRLRRGDPQGFRRPRHGRRCPVPPGTVLDALSGGGRRGGLSPEAEGIGWRMGWDSNPRDACTPAGFQDRCLQPLGHPSPRLPTIATWPRTAKTPRAAGARAPRTTAKSPRCGREILTLL